MLLKKALILSISIVLSCGYVVEAQAGTSCEDKYSYAAFGRLEKSEMDRLKRKYADARRPINNKEKIAVYDREVREILGFSGQQTKTASSGRIEHRIWIDRDNCKRKVKASFKDSKLVRLKSYGF